ncbi:MAG TPA: ABC transporter substrate-binding protein [Pyrinomonadaceae bacterium]|nr:ABC transporter substrate-binding protein [Pyrinomonadaceae bacterium]
MNQNSSEKELNDVKKPQRNGLFIAIILIAIIGSIGVIEAVRRFKPAPDASSARQTETVSNAPNSPFPRALRDANNNELTIQERPRRIVSQTLGTDEILLSITDSQRIVAFSKFGLDPKFSNVVEEVRKTGAPAIQNVEDILQLNPDLIFVASYSRAEIVEQLQSAGAPAFRFANFDRLDDVKTNIRTVGNAIGEEERAENLVKKMEDELAEIRGRIPDGIVPPRVMSYGNAGYTAGSNTLFDDIIRHAGGVNATAEGGIKGFGKISAEQVLEWQPDFIIVGANHGEFEQIRQQLLANPAIAATNAARSNHIILMDNRYFLTVSQFTVRAVDELVKEIYKPQMNAKR